jgi:integrase
VDLHHLKTGRGPGSTYFLVLNIPKELRNHSRFLTSRGRPMGRITESLHTTDPQKACERRDSRLAYWRRQFRVMIEGPSPEDIREEAIDIYRATLEAERQHAVPSEERAKWVHMQTGETATTEEEVLDRLIEEHAAEEIADFCRRTGVSLQPGTAAYRQVGTQFVSAKSAGESGDIKRALPDGLPLLGKAEPPAPVEHNRSEAPPPKKTAETITEAFERYVASEIDGASPDTISHYRRKLAVFVAKFGDVALSKITGDVAVEFLDSYLRNERKVSAQTRNSYAALFAAIFKSAIRRKQATTNPFADQRVKASTTHYEPFSDAELAKLFGDARFEVEPTTHSTATALPWASLISCYSGARLEEVARLTVGDIRQEDGIWYFNLCADGNGKTAASSRQVPLHATLISAGLLAYRDALPADSMLFPALEARASKPTRLGVRLGDAFNKWRQKLGIVRPGICFHSLRHCVGDRLRRAGVQESDIAAVLGHECENITSRVYGHNGPGLKRLQAIIEKIEYAGFRGQT